MAECKGCIKKAAKRTDRKRDNNQMKRIPFKQCDNWSTPDRLTLTLDGRLKMKDGSSLRAYLREVAVYTRAKSPIDMVLCTKKKFQQINIPHCA
jgi:hypothetical protein